MSQIKIPQENVHWLDAKKLVEKDPATWEIEERKRVFVLYRGAHPDAVVNWDGRTADEAQRWLRSVAFARCSRPDCGIRLGAGQKLGDECRNHRDQAMSQKPKDVVCPECGSADLVISLPAAFRWDGSPSDLGEDNLSASEFPIEDSAVVQCQQCEWTGIVSDMREVPQLVEHEVWFEYTETVRYSIPVKLALKPYTTSVQIEEMIEDGRLDWLEEINHTYTTLDIQERGTLMNRRLLDTSVVPPCPVCGEISRGHTCCPPDSKD
jgi:hypothetical protein